MSEQETAGQDVPLDAGLDTPQTPDVAEVREKVEAAAEVSEPSKDPMIAALLRERDAYVTFSKSDRVAAVDAELKRRGYKKAEPKKAAPKKATAKRAEKRA